ncbi:MAG: hypothetical protein AB1898_28105 [Acidobacteriota bacterium]
MAVPLEVYKTQRLMLVRFERAVTGEPDPECPDPDDRGFTTPFGGPLVGVTQGKTVKIRLRRLKIESTAPLFVTSSDTTSLTIAEPGNGQLPSTDQTDIKITGVNGGTDKKEAKVQVRFGSDTGVILHELTVWVWRELDVDVTPHRITINASGTAGTTPTADINAIMRKVGDIWGHYGIRFSVQPVINRTVTFATANIASDSPFPGEIATLLNTDWVPNTINAYFIRQIGTQSTLGYGFSRSSFASFSLPNPGIILADRTGTGTTRSYVMFWANDLAHEIGHFFTLPHVENQQIPNEREDTWSRRTLMHNFNEMRSRNPWPSNSSSGTPFRFRPRFNDAGYGTGRRGCFVTLKNLAQLARDGEATTARSVITSPSGPY